MKILTQVLPLAALGVGVLIPLAADGQVSTAIRGRDGRIVIQHYPNSQDYLQSQQQNRQYYLPPDRDGRYRSSYYVEGDRYYYAPSVDERGRPRSPVAFQYGEFSHTDELAMRLERMANDLCLELHYNYSHNRGFRTTYAEAYQLLEIAKAIHDDIHRDNQRGVRSRLQGIDALFHHLEDDIRRWSRREQRRIGWTSLDEKMSLIETTIHHLMYDAGVPHADEHHHDDRGRRDRDRDRRNRDIAPRPR